RVLFRSSIGTDDRAVVTDEFTQADGIFSAGLFAEAALGINRFGIAGKTFVYPHIGNVVGGNIIAPPFVRAFVDDDEIPFESPAGARKITAHISIFKMVAVGYGALMFHAQMGRFYQLIAVLVKGIRAEPVLKAADHRFNLPELFFCFIQMLF